MQMLQSRILIYGLLNTVTLYLQVLFTSKLKPAPPLASSSFQISCILIVLGSVTVATTLYAAHGKHLSC